MQIEYKLFEQKYLKELVKLQVQLASHLATINKFRTKDPNSKFQKNYLLRYIRQIKGGNTRIILAFDNNQLIGYVVAFVKKQTRDELEEFIKNRFGEITDIFVSEGYRGKGIGSNLIKLAERFLRKKYCKTIEILVLNENIIAYETYKKRGYRDFFVNMIKE